MLPGSRYPILVLALIQVLAAAFLWPGLMTAQTALAAPLDTTADAALGQPDLVSNVINNGALTLPGSRIWWPTGVAVDLRSGRLFVADCFNHRVLSWPDSAAFANGAPADLVLGQADFNGTSLNRGQPVSALGLNSPNGLAVDRQGRLFIADRLNHRVLVFEPPFSSGMAAAVVLGQPDFTSNQPNRGHGPDADTLSEPVAIAIGSSWESIFVADWGNNRVIAYPLPARTGLRAVYLFGQTSFITNLPGTTASTLNQPSGLTFDRDGKILVADSGNHRLLMFGTIGTGGSTAMAVAGQSDFNEGQPNAGNPGPVAGGFSYPIGLVVDMTGRIYVADRDNNRIVRWGGYPAFGAAQEVLGQPNLTSGAANGGGNPAANTLFWPHWLALDGNQNLFVGDFFNNRVLRYDTPVAPSTPIVSTIAPNDVAAGSPAFRLYIRGNYFVRDSTVRWNNTDRPTTFVSPTSLIADLPAGDVISANPAPATVRIYTPPVQGQGGGLSTAEKAIYVYQRRAGDTTADLVMGAPGFSETFGVNSALDVGSVFNPWSAATCPATGRIFVSDGHSGRVLSWPGRQAYVNAQPADLVIGQPDLYLRERNSGMGLSVSARGLDNPDGLALDGVCNLYVADAMNSRVLRFPAPQTTGMAADLVIGQPDFTQDLPNRGLGAPAANTLAIPTGVTVTATGRLFIADRSNHRVTVYDPPLTNGVAASAVLGGQGVTSATTLNMPTNVAVDPAGNLFVADSYNHRVLRFSQPMATGKAADLVIGQSDMSSSSFGTTATALYYPYSMTVDPSGGLLLVADSKNHRVLRYDPPFQTGMAATGVFGQLGSLTNRLENLGGPPSADSMNYPSRLTMDQGRNLYIADTGNNRVLIFDTPLPFREFLPFILR